MKYHALNVRFTLYRTDNQYRAYVSPFRLCTAFKYFLSRKASKIKPRPNAY